MSKPATETLAVVVERELPFPPEKVWRALTQPDLIEEWLMKNDFKPVVDHRFSFRADWGAVDCRVLAVEPNKMLSYTWAAYGLKSVVTSTSAQRAREPTCAWSSRASSRISRSTTRVPRAGGRSSLPPWSRSWRGQLEVCRHRVKARKIERAHQRIAAVVIPELDYRMFPLAEEAVKTLANFRSTVMAGLDPRLSGSNFISIRRPSEKNSRSLMVHSKADGRCV